MTSSARTQTSSSSQHRSNGKAFATPNERWVENTLKRLTLREKIGQLLMVYVYGQFTSTKSPAFKDLLDEVNENKVGGFILGTQGDPLGLLRAQVYPTAALLNELQDQADIPLLVGADFERGTAMRMEEGTSFPAAMGIAATGDPRDAYTVGKVTALEARASGLQWIFAPDADVNDNPDNPIINIRSFGEDPQRVAAFVSEFVKGVEENGAIATAKHFPGHGDVNTDSHLALATVPGDRQRLESVELVPFRAAIAAGVGAIMTGHLAVPAFEPDPTLPATLSPRILTDVLREELGFRGLIVTDALDMGGIVNMHAPGDAAVRAIAAGADVLLLPPNPEAAIAALAQAVESGQLPMSRIDDSVRRILRVKSSLGLVKQPDVDLDHLNDNFARPEFATEALDIADRGITLLRDDAHILPLDATKPIRALLVELSGDPDAWPGPDLEQEIRPRVDSLTVLRADTQYDKVSALQIPPLNNFDVVIASIFVRVADRKGSVGLPDDEAAVVNQLIASGKPTIVTCFGSPYLIQRFPNAKTWIAAFATADVAQRAMARAIFGQVATNGKIPVSVPGVAKIGDGLHLDARPMVLQAASPEFEGQFKHVYDLLDGAVADHAFPGGVLAIGLKNQLLVHPFGRFTYDAKSPEVMADTMYDLASLTKPIVTTTLVMDLSESKDIDLDAPVSRYLPEFLNAAKSDPNPAWRARITVRQLLLHDSGLPAHRDFYKTARNQRDVVNQVLAEPLVSEPGRKVEYSDLGFILLGEILERLEGKPLDELAQESIFEPLGMRNSTFKPARAMRSHIPPTEDDKDYRGRLVQGEVHDQNAWAMDGVAGHAGLFSTAGDIATFAQMMLNGGIYAHNRFLDRATIQQFTARQQIGDSARTLGWDVPTEPSSSGHYFSADSYGHTGFTGTSLWIDPGRELFVIFLTNRVYPSVDNNKIREVRPAVHDAIMQCLGFATARPVSSQ